jgi:hypothetical protein
LITRGGLCFEFTQKAALLAGTTANTRAAIDRISGLELLVLQKTLLSTLVAAHCERGLMVLKGRGVEWKWLDLER